MFFFFNFFCRVVVKNRLCEKLPKNQWKFNEMSVKCQWKSVWTWKSKNCKINTDKEVENKLVSGAYLLSSIAFPAIPALKLKAETTRLQSWIFACNLTTSNGHHQVWIFTHIHCVIVSRKVHGREILLTATYRRRIISISNTAYPFCDTSDDFFEVWTGA